MATLSTSVLYQLVTPAPPDATGPLALRRANAVPTTVSPTYGAPTLPAVRLAADAHTTQPALDAVLAIPYAGNGSDVVALFATRDGAPTSSGPASTSSRSTRRARRCRSAPPRSARRATRSCRRRAARWRSAFVNEKDYPAGMPAVDYVAATFSAR